MKGTLMKPMKTLLSFLLIASSAFADTAVLSWDASPASEGVTSYVVYELVGAVWQSRGESPTPTLTLTSITAGTHTFAVTAKNLHGESSRSSSAVLPALPAPPANVRIVQVTIISP